jgi:cytochrome c oxidase subunit 3
MTVVLVFMAAVMFTFVGWLVSQSIGVQPWVATAGVAIPTSDARLQAQPNGKVGLVVLMAVIGSLFALFMSAYVLRMELADWRPLPEPDLLWLNTGLLALGSFAMHRAFVQSGAGNRAQVYRTMLLAGVFLSLFIAGQILAWQQLRDLNYFATSNPANAFFYLITGLHVLHLLGGLVAWVRTFRLTLSVSDIAEARLSIQLTGIYVHFLLVVWFVLFALLLNT